MALNLNFLASAKFGWFFIWSEIILTYLAFLWFHRIAERKRKKGIF